MSMALKIVRNQLLELLLNEGLATTGKYISNIWGFGFCTFVTCH